MEARHGGRGLDSRHQETRPLTLPSKLCDAAGEARGKQGKKYKISDKDRDQRDSLYHRNHSGVCLEHVKTSDEINYSILRSFEANSSL